MKCGRHSVRIRKLMELSNKSNENTDAMNLYYYYYHYYYNCSLCALNLAFGEDPGNADSALTKSLEMQPSAVQSGGVCLQLPDQHDGEEHSDVS